jgi:DNA-binding transcriptional ArsR family regulator
MTRDQDFDPRLDLGVADPESIEYRRLSMDISRDDAATWATWFRALGDPTRILILNLLATEERPMSVAEIVEAVDVGQSTVSHHLKILGDVRFLLVEREGTTSWWRINERCLDCFPTAAELVMGRLPAHAPWDVALACTPTPNRRTR